MTAFTELDAGPSVGSMPDQPFGVLLDVELRKMVDTRAGRALLVASVVACLGVIVWKLTHPDTPVAFDNYSRGVTTMLAFGIPLLGALALTAEWSERTALTTFTLSPRRLPVLAAKYLAAAVLAVAAVALGLLLAAAGVVVGGMVHGSSSFDGSLGDIRYAAIFIALQVSMAAAFGLLAASTPVALSAFLLAPTLWAVLSEHVLGSAEIWFDISDAYGRLASSRPLDDVDATITSIFVWVVVPGAIGLRRTLQREIA